MLRVRPRGLVDYQQVKKMVLQLGEVTRHNAMLVEQDVAGRSIG
jgi:hypothetical protein